jgi:hypothetical protein
MRMIITGCNRKFNNEKAIEALRKHANLSIPESKKIIDLVFEGKSYTIVDDFILMEDLEEAGLIISTRLTF